jgi:hypothetical protein
LELLELQIMLQITLKPTFELKCQDLGTFEKGFGAHELQICFKITHKSAFGKLSNLIWLPYLGVIWE